MHTGSGMGADFLNGTDKKVGNCASEMLFSRTTVSRIVKVIRNRVIVAFWLSLLCYFKNGKTT